MSEEDKLVLEVLRVAQLNQDGENLTALKNQTVDDLIRNLCNKRQAQKTRMKHRVDECTYT